MDNYYVNLNYRELLVVSGIDSERFLQGQLSCDLGSLSALDSCLGCLCDNKGRVIASFTLWKIADVFYMEMEAGVATLAKQHLKKYSVFYKSNIAIENGAFARFGLIGPGAERYLATHFSKIPSEVNRVEQKDESYLRLADPINRRYELWQQGAPTNSIQSDADFDLPEGKLKNWKLFDQSLGLYRIQADDAALYTPQELNYDQLGHISFTKGCYTGQEIVARMHYLGKAKKRLYLLQITADSSPKKNMLISTTENKTAGEIIDIAVLATNKYQVLAIGNELLNESLQIDQLDLRDIKLITH